MDVSKHNLKGLGEVELTLVHACVSALQLAMRGPSGPMGLTGRSGPVVSLFILRLFVEFDNLHFVISCTCLSPFLL